MFSKKSDLNRLEPNKTVVPKSHVPGMNTKTLGRVAPVEPNSQGVPTKTANRASIERASVTKTASVEKTACSHSECEKTAAVTVGDVLKTHVLGGIGGAVAAAAANAAISKGMDLISQPAYKRSLQKAISLNPRLQSQPRAKLEEYFGLIVEASPAVARNPLLVANYLDFLLDHQGQMNLNAYTSLVNLESQVLSNRANSSPLSHAVQKAIVDNSVRGMFDSYGKIERDDLRNEGKREGFRYGFESATEGMRVNPMGGE